MKFNFQAKTKEGIKKSGQIEAFSKEAAIEILQRHGLYPILIEEAELSFYKKQFFSFKKISPPDLIVATRELAMLFRSGVPIVEALNSVAKESRSPKLKEVFSSLAKDVETGSVLSAAMSKYPNIFQKIYIAIVKIGEISGELTKSLETIAENIEKNYYLSLKIRNALIYPALVFFLAVIIFFIVVFYLLPKLAFLSKEMGAELPATTKFLLGFANFFRSWWFILAIVIGGTISALLFYIKTPAGKEEFDNFLFKLPMWGNFLKMNFLAAFSRNLALLIAGGIPISQALEITEELTTNSIYKRVMSLAKEAIRGGESISSFFKDYPQIFPSFFCQMVFTGEKTGALTKALTNTANFYEQEVERWIGGFISLLGPILIVIMGGLVGFIVFVVLMSLYQIISFG